MLPEELKKLLAESGIYGAGLQGILLDAALRRLITSPRPGVLTLRKERESNGKFLLTVDYAEDKKL